MNRNRIEGSWEQLKGHVQKAWGKLTNDDLNEIEGDRKLLAGKIQERYGVAQDEAELQIRRWNDDDDTVDSVIADRR
ncbi:CsbD family protein [Asticcacaulis excentricus]|uniref:CsbD family protein n=1 Tax=Asticcacaulis excentricus (strain ATCC 15261 / DSM 4724 / KCTC 12464 / NCIMB 9791 / VKM B-1370 / CB 48) TaxID=573065 RepID=E8RLR5_ASTEC|nr:CsbD family protein [Asticcacaulis excentricus]ADU12682.1 CsbD family protein [Asticcacaulis excentricus CB 48]